MVFNFFQRLKERPVFKLILKSFSIAFAERLLRILLNVVIQIIMARSLGPEVFGEITVVTKFVGIFIALPVFGLDELIVAELIKEKHEERSTKILFGAFCLRIALATVAFVMLLFSAHLAFGFNSIKFNQSLILGLIYFAYPFFTFELFFQKNFELHLAAMRRAFGTTLISIMRVFGSVKRLSSFYFILLNTFEYFFLGLSFYFLYLKRNKKLGWKKPDYRIIINLMKSAIPTAVSAFVLLIEQRYSLLVVEKYASAATLGVFSLAVTILDIIQYLPLTIGVASFPALVTIYENSKEKYYLKVQHIMNAVFLLNSVLLFSHLVLGEFFIDLVLGQKYIGLSEMLTWIIACSFLYSVNHIRIRWLTIVKSQKVWLIFSIVSASLSVMFLSQLVGVYGPNGVFISWILSQLIANLVVAMFYTEFRKTFKSILLSPWFIYVHVRGLIR